MRAAVNVVHLVILLALLLAACAPAARTPIPTPPTSLPASQIAPAVREAQVQAVQVLVLSADPARYNAVVRGSFTESCATLGESQVSFASNVFQIKVLQVTPADRGCAPAATPFETTIPLDTNSLPAGSYTVNANGVRAVFAIPSDNPLPTATAVAAPTRSACVDAAAFVSDVSIPDNAVITSGAPFTKTWRLKNSGTCTWSNDYLVFYIRGATMSQSPGYWIVQPGQAVAPGQTVDVSVGMTAPAEPGTYTSYWGLKSEDGAFIPIRGGANGNSFFVRILVKDADSAPVGHITGSSIDIVLEQGSGIACTPQSTYFVTAEITADGPTAASYEIGSTAGQIPAGYFQTSYGAELSPYVTGSLVFDRADTKRIPLHFVGPYPIPDDITINLRVNGGSWQSTRLSCN